MANENGRKRMMRRGLAPIFAALFLTVAYACSETAVAPHAASDAEMFASGVVSSAVQDVKDGQLVYRGSVSSSVSLKKTSRGFESTGEKAIPVGSMSSKGFALPTAVPFGFPTYKATTGVSASHTPGPPQVWRARLNTPVRKFVTADGKKVSAQFVNDLRGGGRPPVSMLVYDGTRPSQFIEFKYAKDGKKWRAAEARTTIFGADGKPSNVITSDFRALQQGSLNVGSRLNITPLLREIGSEFGRLIQPDVLYAATVDEELDDEGLPNCLSSKLWVASAVVLLAGTTTALAPAAVGCVTVIGCPVFLAALLAHEGAILNLAAAIASLWECQHPAPATRVIAQGGNPGGGGGPSGGEEQCAMYMWEISYDGGVTWYFHHEEEICTRQYDM